MKGVLSSCGTRTDATEKEEMYQRRAVTARVMGGERSEQEEGFSQLTFVIASEIGFPVRFPSSM